MYSHKNYVPSPDEPSVFTHDVNTPPLIWTRWDTARRSKDHYKKQKPCTNITGLVPFCDFGVDRYPSVQKDLREQLKAGYKPPPGPERSMFIRNTRKISLLWVLSECTSRNVSPETVMKEALAVRDVHGATVYDGEKWIQFMRFCFQESHLTLQAFAMTEASQKAQVHFILYIDMPAGAVSIHIVKDNPAQTEQLVANVFLDRDEVVCVYKDDTIFTRIDLDNLLKVISTGTYGYG